MAIVQPLGRGGPSPYQTGAQILSLIQTLCSDPQGQLFTATFCLAAMNSGIRYVARELSNRGKMTLIVDEYLVTIPPVTAQDPTQQVNLTYTGIDGNLVPANDPALPPTLLEPLILWERPSGTSIKLVEMRNMTAKGGLRKTTQGNSLDEWEWRGDMIVFRGSLSSTDVMIRGTQFASILSLDQAGNVSGSLGDIDTGDAVAYKAAAILLPQRGAGALAQQYEAQAQLLIEQSATSVTRQEQMAPVRMRGYRSGRRRGSFSRSL
jgi:hypothetical protein